MKSITDEKWNAMFDLQDKLCKEIDGVIRDAVGKGPGMVEAMALLYIIEHLAERARFCGELPDLPWTNV